MGSNLQNKCILLLKSKNVEKYYQIQRKTPKTKPSNVVSWLLDHRQWRKR